MFAVKFQLLAVPMLVSLIFAAPSFARGNDFVITDGMGEEIQIRNGLFGKKTKVVKDRLGNGFKQETGIFGGKTTEASILGNEFKKKKGLLGGSDISASTIFGDNVKTKKGIFGRRTTTVDLSGSSKLIQSFFGPRKGVAAAPQGSIDSQNSFNSQSSVDAQSSLNSTDPSFPTGGN